MVYIYEKLAKKDRALKWEKRVREWVVIPCKSRHDGVHVSGQRLTLPHDKCQCLLFYCLVASLFVRQIARNVDVEKSW